MALASRRCQRLLRPLMGPLTAPLTAPLTSLTLTPTPTPTLSPSPLPPQTPEREGPSPPLPSLPTLSTNGFSTHSQNDSLAFPAFTQALPAPLPLVPHQPQHPPRHACGAPAPGTTVHLSGEPPCAAVSVPGLRQHRASSRHISVAAGPLLAPRRAGGGGGGGGEGGEGGGGRGGRDMGMGGGMGFGGGRGPSSSPPGGGGRPQRGGRGGGSQDDAPYVQPWWTYTLTEIPPDTTASRLSDASKEEMYARHQGDPDLWTVQKLAKEYRIREQRVHAILWLKELQRKAEAEAEARGETLDDSVHKAVEAAIGPVSKAAREQHITIFPSEAVDALQDPEERTRKLLEESAREERLLLEEFVQRLNFNKMQASGKVKVAPVSRRRPQEGWSYVVEELGEEGRRGRGGGRRYVVGPDGTKRGLNEFEKQFLQREKPRPRRRIVVP